MLLARWLQNEAVQMTLKTYQVLDQQEGWNMRCHYVPAIFTFSLSHSPFQFSYSLFKLLNLQFVKAWKMNNSINNKSCSRSFYFDRSWKICFKDFLHDILFCSVSLSWDISTVIIFLSFSVHHWQGYYELVYLLSFVLSNHHLGDRDQPKSKYCKFFHMFKPSTFFLTKP